MSKRKARGAAKAADQIKTEDGADPALVKEEEEANPEGLVPYEMERLKM